MQCIDEQLTVSLPLITCVCSKVTGFVEVSLPGGKPKPYNSLACGPICPTLVFTLYPSIHVSVPEVTGQEQAGDWMLW